MVGDFSKDTRGVMKKGVLLLVCVLVLSLTSCMTVRVEAPRGQSVILQSGVDNQPLVAKKKAWYILWGLVPISNNSIAKTIEQEKLREVSCKTYYSFSDYLLAVVLNIFPTTLQTTTVEIRGK